MQPTSKSLRHFANHLFIAGKIYIERKKARDDVDSHIHRMRKSIIRMSLTYSDIDKLKEKIHIMIEWEGRYAKLFKPEDKETTELKKKISDFGTELAQEREEKQKTSEENSQKIAQLTEALNNVKSKTNYLLMERAKRHQRLIALEKKINEKIDVHGYYHK